jgi:hypothetical protein
VLRAVLHKTITCAALANERVQWQRRGAGGAQLEDALEPWHHATW